LKLLDLPETSISSRYLKDRINDLEPKSKEKINLNRGINLSEKG
jgi:hypothetical protein